MSELQGLIVAAHGRHYLAHANGKALQCVTRGKKSDVATGDRVRLTATSPDQAVIDEILPRDTLLYRSDQYKSKLLASNVTQLFIVVATEPGFSDDLISRSLVAANAAGITARLILNKTDLKQLLPVARAKLALVNLLVPDAEIAVREISQRLDTGKHTTTFTRLYTLDEQSSVIDSPGFQEFGLYHLTEGMLERAFPEFEPVLGQCRFTNCHHVAEPDCAVLKALEEGSIHAGRHQLYLQLRHESLQKPHY